MYVDEEAKKYYARKTAAAGIDHNIETFCRKVGLFCHYRDLLQKNRALL